MSTGNCRVVLAWAAPRSGDPATGFGHSATGFGHSSARAVSSSSSAVTVNVWVSASAVIVGGALRLWYQLGGVGDPPLAAQIAHRPPGWGGQAPRGERPIPGLAPIGVL